MAVSLPFCVKDGPVTRDFMTLTAVSHDDAKAQLQDMLHAITGFVPPVLDDEVAHAPVTPVADADPLYLDFPLDSSAYDLSPPPTETSCFCA